MAVLTFSCNSSFCFYKILLPNSGGRAAKLVCSSVQKPGAHLARQMSLVAAAACQSAVSPGKRDMSLVKQREELNQFPLNADFLEVTARQRALPRRRRRRPTLESLAPHRATTYSHNVFTTYSDVICDIPDATLTSNIAHGRRKAIHASVSDQERQTRVT